MTSKQTYPTITPSTKNVTDDYFSAFSFPPYETGSEKNPSSSISDYNNIDDDMFPLQFETKYRCCVENELHELMCVLIENIRYFLKFCVVELLPLEASNDYTGYIQKEFQLRPGKIAQTLVSSRRLNGLLDSITKLDMLDKFLEGMFRYCTNENTRMHELSQLQDLLLRIEKKQYEFATFPEIPAMTSEKYSYKFCCTVIESTAFSCDEKSVILHQLDNIKHSQGEYYEENESMLTIFE